MARKPDPIKTAAQRIRNAMKSGRPCKPIRDLLKKGDVDAAYAIQQANTDIWIQEGRRTPEQAAGYMARFCSCGVFNTCRAARILRKK